MSRRLIALHRTVGIVACLGILSWSAGGVLHPIMSRLQPQPVLRAAPPVALPSGVDLPQLLQVAEIVELEGVQPLTLDGRPHLRVAIPGTSDGVYLDAESGERLADGERRHAEALARHFSGEQQAAVTAVRRLTAFDSEYTYVNRLLPVWRIDFDRADGLRAYVETAGNRLGTLSDNRQARLAATFRFVHSWSWAEPLGLLRPIMMSVLLAATFATALLGLAMAFRLRKPSARQPLRRWHRRTGLLVGLSALTFSGSGAYHLWHGTGDTPMVEKYRQVFTPAALAPMPRVQPGEGLALVAVNDRVLWRIADAPGNPGENHHHHGAASANAQLSGARYLDIATHQPLADAAEAHAVGLAVHYRSLAPDRVKEVATITTFGGEYGFVNKRLPVVKVQFDTPDRDAVYVETASNELAAHVTDADRREGWSFGYLHKWHFLDIDKDVRDLLQALFAFGNGVVAVMGLSLFFRRYPTNSSKRKP